MKITLERQFELQQQIKANGEWSAFKEDSVSAPDISRCSFLTEKQYARSTLAFAGVAA